MPTDLNDIQDQDVLFNVRGEIEIHLSGTGSVTINLRKTETLEWSQGEEITAPFTYRTKLLGSDMLFNLPGTITSATMGLDVDASYQQAPV